MTMGEVLTSDIETYFDMFSAGFYHKASGSYWVFEVSDRRNDATAFYQFCAMLRQNGDFAQGFNFLHFDYPVIHHLLNVFEATGTFSAQDAYQKAQQIISSQDRFGHVIWESDRRFKVIDLFKIHHFDNPAKSTSLKKLEVNMRSRRVIDLPYSPHSPLTSAQKDHVIAYMGHDIAETAKFADYSAKMIEFRLELAQKYPEMGDVINFNDTKIGKKYFEIQIEKAVPGSTYSRVDGRRRPNQTWRTHINIGEIISPKVAFNHPEFNRVLTWLRGQTLRPSDIESAEESERKVATKGVFAGLHATVRDFTFHFGTGGIHGSVARAAVYEDEQYEIIDVDVSSFYPNLAIVNRWYPQHLGQTFPAVYKEVYDMRQSYGKKTSENAMLKLALNGVYGDSNNVHGCFYDPQYTMTITINGQLMLCMLAEAFTNHPDIQMIQANTDGVTIRSPRSARAYVEQVVEWWQMVTGLELETAYYKSMHIRDVNNYIAVKTDGSIKRIGAYAYETPIENPATRELGWHKDHSNRVVMKAAEAQMVHGTPVSDFVFNHRDQFDFMGYTKAGRGSHLEFGEEIVQSTCRFYVSTVGKEMTKVMPPLKGKTEPRRTAIQKGYTLKLVNDADEFDWQTVNWHYYITEARKLLI